MAKSLASHISSNGRSQFGAIKIGASVSFFLTSGKLRCNLQRKRMVYPFQKGIRRALVMLEIMSRRFFLKLNLSNHKSILTDLQRVRSDNGTEFKNKTLAKFFDEVGITQQFSTARMPQQNGVVERRNRTLVEAARTMLTCANLPSFLWAEAIATSCFAQNHVIFSMIMRMLESLRQKEYIGVFVGYSKESAAFRIYNKRTHKIHESVNVNFDEISEMASKQFSLEPGLSNLNEMGKSSNPSIMKSSTLNVKTSINEEVFHEVSESFQGKSSSSFLNDDVQHSPEEVILPQTNTQSIPINMIPNGDEASTSHNVFNERLEDAYFDVSTSFHDPSNV
nr:hypothetical protein [Tanacetum cinerariifolium]